MITSEVQRTLVKSPPELWAELSDPSALARHLSELPDLGEIRVTKIEPETLLEWEAEGTSGSVTIKASNWGTKVTLKVSREAPVTETEPESETTQAEAEAPEAEPDEFVIQSAVEAEPELLATPEPAAEPEPIPEAESPTLTAAERFAPDYPPSLRAGQLEAQPEEEPEKITAVEPPSPASEPELEPELEPIKRRGFFARLFGWGKPEPEPTSEPAAEPPPAFAPTSAHARSLLPEAPEPIRTPIEPQTRAALEPELESRPREAEWTAEQTPAAQAPEPDVTEPQAEPDSPADVAETPAPPDLAAELLAAEEQVTAALTAVLDRLGAAHHRPFSRA